MQGLGFFGGGYIIACQRRRSADQWARACRRARRPGAANGSAKPSNGIITRVHFNTQGSVYAHRDNYMDLDPTYRDALGRPLLRLTYNGTDNDHAMSRYLLYRAGGRHQGDGTGAL